VHTEDKISIFFTFTTAMFILYLATFLGNPPNLDLPITMLTSGLLLQLYIRGKIQKDSTMSKNELTQIVQYSLLALSGMFIASWTIPQLFVPSSVVALTTTDAIIHGQIFAVSEEIFFRGAVTGFILWIFPSGFHLGFMGFVIDKKIVVIFLSGSVFAFYHLAVYGISQATLYVLVAGIILTAVTVYSKRISPAIISHMINNYLSVVT